MSDPRTGLFSTNLCNVEDQVCKFIFPQHYRVHPQLNTNAFIYKEGRIIFIRHRTKMMIRCAIAGMAVAGLPAAILLVFHGRKEADLKARVQYYENMSSDSFYTNVYVLNSSVCAGEVIDESFLDKRTVSSSDRLNLSVTELADITGMRAKIALPAGSVMTPDLVYAGPGISDDERILDLNNVVLPYGLKEGDIVDIRISFPNGEDYVVVKHKTVHSLITDAEEVTGFSVNANEQEILRLSSAGVDTEMYDDTVIYGVTYRGDFQEPATEYYPVNPDVFELLGWDPNIKELFTVTAETERRKKLEKHLQGFVSDVYLPDDTSGEMSQETKNSAEQAESIFESPELYTEE